MSRKPETTFIGSVHRHLPVDLHREKMNNPYHSGTADVWYSGRKADQWVEYKFIVIPAREQTAIVADLSPLQSEWLAKRHSEGRRVGVVIGCRQGGVVLQDLAWEKAMSTAQFKQRLQTRVQLAEWITQQTT